MKKIVIGLVASTALLVGCGSDVPPPGWGVGVGQDAEINGVTFMPRDGNDEIMVTVLANDPNGCGRVYYINRWRMNPDEMTLLATWCPIDEGK